MFWRSINSLLLQQQVARHHKCVCRKRPGSSGVVYKFLFSQYLWSSIRALLKVDSFTAVSDFECWKQSVDSAAGSCYQQFSPPLNTEEGETQCLQSHRVFFLFRQRISSCCWSSCAPVELLSWMRVSNSLVTSSSNGSLPIVSVAGLFLQLPQKWKQSTEMPTFQYFNRV